MCSPELHRDSPDEGLIAYCANPPVSQILGSAPYGNKVIRLSDDEVIKFGVGVTREEAENQKRAFSPVDHNIICVPRVYRFSENGSGLGYLIMEYMAGKVIDPLEDSTCIEKIARVLTHFTSLHGNIPSMLSGSPSCGLIFPEAKELTFASVKVMEAWFNSRLFAQDPKLSLQGCELVLCYLDIAPRNILWLKDGSICFLDWASAGYYPRIFEFCAQWIIEHAGIEGKFNQLLLDSMENLMIGIYTLVINLQFEGHLCKLREYWLQIFPVPLDLVLLVLLRQSSGLPLFTEVSLRESTPYA